MGGPFAIVIVEFQPGTEPIRSALGYPVSELNRLGE